MMMFLWLWLLAGVWLAGLARLTAGELAWLVPSLALAAVLLSARWSPPGRSRRVALWAGLMAGLPLQGTFLVPALVLLLLAAVAHHTRRLFPLNGPLGLLSLGCVYAGLQQLLLRLAPGLAPAQKPLTDHWLLALCGLFLTGVLYLALELAVAGSGRLRHVLQRS